MTFQKKFLQSDAYKRAMVAQKPVITEFGTKAYPDPNKGLLSRLVHSIVSFVTAFCILNKLEEFHPVLLSEIVTFRHVQQRVFREQRGVVFSVKNRIQLIIRLHSYALIRGILKSIIENV